MDIEKIKNNVWIINNTFHGESNILATYMIDSDKITIIDPGAPVQSVELVKQLEKLGKIIDVIALTHIHLDHASGSWNIIERNPNITIYVHPRGVNHLIDPTDLLKAANLQFKENMPDYGIVRGVPEKYIRQTKDEEIIEIGKNQLKIIWTPGHSTHSQSFYEPQNRILFVGDAAGHIIKDVVLPASPPPFSPKQSIDSVDKMLELDPKIICISHYGYKSDAVDYLRKYKDKVKAWEELSHEAVKNNFGLNELFNMIHKEDPEVQELVTNYPDEKGNVYSSLAGFFSYAKWVNQKNDPK